MADRDACATLARPSPYRWDWADLPGPLQVIPHSGGRALPRGVRLRRTQCTPGEPRPARAGLALVEFMASRTPDSSAVVERVADGNPAAMDCHCKSSTKRGRASRTAA